MISRNPQPFSEPPTSSKSLLLSSYIKFKCITINTKLIWIIQSPKIYKITCKNIHFISIILLKSFPTTIYSSNVLSSNTFFFSSAFSARFSIFPSHSLIFDTNSMEFWKYLVIEELRGFGADWKNGWTPWWWPLFGILHFLSAYAQNTSALVNSSIWIFHSLASVSPGNHRRIGSFHCTGIGFHRPFAVAWSKSSFFSSGPRFWKYGFASARNSSFWESGSDKYWHFLMDFGSFEICYKIDR